MKLSRFLRTHGMAMIRGFARAPVAQGSEAVIMVRNWFCGFPFVAACFPVARAQTTFTIQIAVDNDYAVFTGTSSSVTRLLYQNNTDWTSQIGSVASLNFGLETGETSFNILAMDDAGDAQVNGVNLVDLFNGNNASVKESSDISSYLTRYSISGTAIEDGSYTVSLSQVQAAFSSVTWGTPSVVQVSSGAPAVVAGNCYAYSTSFSNYVGFYSIQGGAALFSFSAQDVGVAVTAVPEPATWAEWAGFAALDQTGNHLINGPERSPGAAPLPTSSVHVHQPFVQTVTR